MLEHTQIACTTCNYNLTGLDLAGNCPECGSKIITNCYQCDYLLDGLDPSTQCPECGFPISDSVGRGVLARCDPAYLAKLHKGVVLIESAIILMIFHVVASVLFSVFAAALTGSYMATQVIIVGSSFLITLVFVFGWYRFSTPNPRRDGPYAGSKARRWIRVMLALTVLAAMLGFFNIFVMYNNWIVYVLQAVSLFSMAVFAVRFYSEMFYIRWMAPLLRNKRAHKRTITLMWMGPILLASMIVVASLGVMLQPTIGMTGGILIAVGALAMLIMYWNMLDWIRKDLKAIRQSHHAIA